MPYVIESPEHGYLQFPEAYVENVEYALVFSTFQNACDYIEFFGLDNIAHRIVKDDTLEADEFENDYRVDQVSEE